MANIVTLIVEALRNSLPKINSNFLNINNQLVNHVGGTADNHPAQHITYSGTDVKTALDNVKADINNLSFTGSEHDALVTGALVDADGTDYGADGTGTYLNGRLTAWEQKHNAHLAAYAQDIADLQNNKANKTDINSLATEKADITYVNTLTQSIASGSPKGVYTTLEDLQTAFPSGDSNIYVVTTDGKWYYWSGSTWAVGGDYQTTIVKSAINATNLIINGNFIDTTGWDAVSSSNGTLSTANNELTYTIVGLVSSSRIQQTTSSAIVGHKYYVRGDIYPKYANTSYTAFGGVNAMINPTTNIWNTIKSIATAINTTGFKLYHPTNSGYVVGDTFKFRNMIVVDLTATYGEGNEPTLSDFEKELSKFTSNWFDGTVELEPPIYLTQAYDAKVDKVEGKGLSTNDYTDADKAAVSKISKTIILVEDFVNLRFAMESITDATVTNQYEVQIGEGTYDLISMYTQTEIENTSFVGFIVPNYVSLVGMGKKENTIIQMEIPDNYDSAAFMRVAPIANQGNGDLKNLTVIGKNCRYTVHDDYAYDNAVKHTENCTFKKLVGQGNSQAWGEGTGSGMEFYFEDCEFITEYNQASYSTHNNEGHTEPTYHSFKNCKFINNGGYYGVRFITLNSGQIERVNIEGCYIDGIIKFEENTPGVGCRYDLHGYGNTEVPILIDATDGSQPVYIINEETKLMYNADTITITKGTPVMLNNDGSVILKLGTNSINLLFGITMQDISVGLKGMVKIKGYYPITDSGLTLIKGDTVGIVNGALAKVTNGDYIGVVTRSDSIKLKF